MKFLLALTASALLSTAAFANDDCAKAPKPDRQAKIAVLMKASQAGYKDIRISADCGCIDVRATKDGQKAQLRYDGATLALIKEEING